MNRMKITSSYRMKLTGDLKALESSIRIYREALRFIIPIVDAHWDEIKNFKYIHQRMARIEKLIHSTKKNQAQYNFDERFPKLPTYLRRAALNCALGIVSSYRSNLANWEKEPKGQIPQLSLTHYTYPAYYKGNLFRNFDPIRQTIELNTQLGRIKRNQKCGSRHNKTLWRKVAGISQDIADKTVKTILDFGNAHGVDVFVLEHLDFKGKNIVKRAHFWRYKRIYKVLSHKAHQYGLRVARVNARYTSRLAFDGSGWSKRGREITPETPYALMQFVSGKIYNADLNASYNIGARYFIRHLLKTVTVTQRLALEAKVPQVAKRSTCTLSHLINLRSEFVALAAKTQA